MRAIYAVSCYQKVVESVQCQTPNISHVRKWNAVDRKCQHHALLYTLEETSQHHQSFHHSIHPCQMRRVSGNNQLLPRQLCFFYLLCWLHLIQWGHWLPVELQLSSNLNHWRDHEGERMFWNFLDLKQIITLTDQSTSICKNDVVRIKIYLCQEMQWQHFHNFRSLLRGLHEKKKKKKQIVSLYVRAFW